MSNKPKTLNWIPGDLMRFPRWALIFSLIAPCLALAQSAQPGSGETISLSGLKTYVDNVNGISFRYPSTWLLNQGGGAYIPTLILQKANYDPEGPEYKPDGYVALVGRDAPKGPYRHTNFINGWFLYRVVSRLDEEHCNRRADLADVPSDQKVEWKADWVTIGGIRFRRGSGSGASLCNQSSQDIYATLHDNSCYLFETQINTICEQHGENGIRDITPKELKEINRAFDAVVQSVRLEDISVSKKIVHLEGEKALSLISILVDGGAVGPALKEARPMPHKAEFVLHDLHVYLASTSKYDEDAWIYKLNLYGATAKIGSSENPVEIGEATALWGYLVDLGLKTDLSLGSTDLLVNQVDCGINAEKPFSAPERFQCDLTVPGWALR